MAKQPEKLPNCPHCWDNKCACHRVPESNACRKCIKLAKNASMNIMNIEHVVSYNHANLIRIRNEMARIIGIGLYTSVDITIELQRCNSHGQSLRGHDPRVHASRLDGPFELETPLFAAHLDDMVNEMLSAHMPSADPSSIIISQATLIGGYAFLLCATVEARTQLFPLWHHGCPEITTPNADNIYSHFQLLLLLRFYQLLGKFLGAVYCGDPSGRHRSQNRDAYAAIQLLKYELGFYRKALTCDFLASFQHLSIDLKTELVDHLTFVGKSLSHHLHLGCGLFPDWRDAISTPIKRIIRKERIIKLRLVFHQSYTANAGGVSQISTIRFPQSPDVEHAYTPVGDGNISLSLPESPTLPHVPSFTCEDVLLTEEAYSHVSGPLSSSTEDTREDTSDYSCRLLFPNSGYHKRYNYSE